MPARLSQPPQRPDRSQSFTASRSLVSPPSNEAYLSDLPSLQQQDEAIAVLKDFDDDQIIDWLDLLRLPLHNIEHISYPSFNVNRLQLQALLQLKGRPNGLLQDWLRASRIKGGPNGPRTSANSSLSGSRRAAAAACSLQNTRRLSSKSTIGSSILPATPSSSQLNQYSPSAFRTSFSRGSSFKEASGDDSPCPPSVHTHVCTNPTCPNPKIITTCDGYKRHEKEHEFYYVCMPDEPVENPSAGARCAFCGVANPDQAHLIGHSYATCLGNLETARKYSRPNVFHQHLESHGALRSSELAKRWRCKTRAVFACRYCGYISSTIADHINHTDTEHYRRLQEINDWDPSTAIRALLLTDSMKAAWHRELASKNLSSRTTIFKWQRAVAIGAGGLQIRLEMNTEDAAALAAAAFQLGSYDFNMDCQSLEGLSHGDMCFGGMLPMQLQSTAASNIIPNIEHTMNPWLPAVIPEQHAANSAYGPFHTLTSSTGQARPGASSAARSCLDSDDYEFDAQAFYDAPWSQLSATEDAQVLSQPLRVASLDDTSFLGIQNWQTASSPYSKSVNEIYDTSLSSSYGDLPTTEGQLCNSSVALAGKATSRHAPSISQSSAAPQSQHHKKSSTGLTKLIRRASSNLLKGVVQPKLDIDLDKLQRFMCDDEQARSNPGLTHHVHNGQPRNNPRRDHASK